MIACATTREIQGETQHDTANCRPAAEGGPRRQPRQSTAGTAATAATREARHRASCGTDRSVAEGVTLSERMACLQCASGHRLLPMRGCQPTQNNWVDARARAGRGEPCERERAWRSASRSGEPPAGRAGEERSRERSDRGEQSDGSRRSGGDTNKTSEGVKTGPPCSN